MTEDDALKVLGLQAGATVDAIESRYRELAPSKHPDRGGPIDDMRQLNEAREIARTAAARMSALVPIDAVRDLVLAGTQEMIKHQEASQEVNRVSSKMKQTMTGRLRRRRRTATILGGAAAAALFLSKDLPEQFVTYVQTVAPERVAQMGPMVAFTSIIIGLYLSVLFWLITVRIEHIENDLDELSGFLSTRSNYVSLLVAIVSSVSSWTLEDLQRDIAGTFGNIGFRQSPLRHLLDDFLPGVTPRGQVGSQRPNNEEELLKWAPIAREVGAADFAMLLLAKGKELNLLTHDETFDGRRLIERYGLSLSRGPV